MTKKAGIGVIRRRRIAAQAKSERLREEREELKSLHDAEQEIAITEGEVVSFEQERRPPTLRERLGGGLERFRIGFGKARETAAQMQEHGQGVTKRMDGKHKSPILVNPDFDFDLYGIGKKKGKRRRRKKQEHGGLYYEI